VEVDTSAAGVNGLDTVRVMALKDVGVSSDRNLLCFDRRGLSTSEGPCEAGNSVVVFGWNPDSCVGCGGAADTVKTSVLGKVLR
jgi:hypothetical protein